METPEGRSHGHALAPLESSFEEWKLARRSEPHSRVWLLNLPLRNGNRRGISERKALGIALEFSFEEWKQRHIHTITNIRIPTLESSFEEWKRDM